MLTLRDSPKISVLDTAHHLVQTSVRVSVQLCRVSRVTAKLLSEVGITGEGV